MKTLDICGFYPILYFLVKILFLTLLIFIYCEFIIYYFVLLSCSWPQLSKLNQDFTIESPKDSNRKPLHVMFIADTHLFSSRETHWFNKIRREWQMYRSFQSANFLFEPRIIFFLGDLTADGQSCSDNEWNKTIERFHSLFSIPFSTRLYVIAGNHDIGFHYEVTDGHLKRFQQSFHTPHVHLVTVNDDNIHFILINSMAFEGDECRLCAKAENELNEIVDELNQRSIWTKPVLLSHFPMHRTSDANCSQWSSTSLKSPLQFSTYKESSDVLSQEATEHLFTTLKPRLVFTAHTHNYCYIEHHRSNDKIIQEWTVPSFSWQNRDDPSFILLTITSNNQHVSHCYLPREATVLWSYIIGIFLAIFYMLFGGRRPFSSMVEDIDNLNEMILSMAKKRGLNKTFCPSEIARQLASKEDQWRSLMEPIRSAAAKLIDKGQLVCKQNGEIVDIRTIKGPIRLQLASD